MLGFELTFDFILSAYWLDTGKTIDVGSEICGGSNSLAAARGSLRSGKPDVLNTGVLMVQCFPYRSDLFEVLKLYNRKCTVSYQSLAIYKDIIAT